MKYSKSLVARVTLRLTMLDLITKLYVSTHYTVLCRVASHCIDTKLDNKALYMPRRSLSLRIESVVGIYFSKEVRNMWPLLKWTYITVFSSNDMQ